MSGTCSVRGCSTETIAKGLCKKHYNKEYWLALSKLSDAERAKRFPRNKFLSEEVAAERKRKIAASQARYYRDNKEKIRVRVKFNGLRKLYGLTQEQYERMIARQRGLCAICRKPPKNKYGLCVDHCHRTGRVRGLLCAGCNTALTTLERGAIWTKSALLYLGRHK